MPAQELVRCHCLVTVEVGGKALHPDKKAKESGVQVVQAGTGVSIRVLGFRRDIALTSRNVRMVVESKIGEGRLAFDCKDNMRVVLSKAQASQLHAIVKALKGEGSGGGLTSRTLPGKGLGLGNHGSSATSKSSLAPRPVATPSKVLRSAGEETTNTADAKLSLSQLPEQVVKEVLSFMTPSLLPLLGEACKSLEQMTVATGSTFRLARSCSRSVAPVSLLQRIQRQTKLQLLDLSSFEGLTAGLSKDLAEVLDEVASTGGSMLKSLCLRGCKAMTDASVRRLLRSCPHLKSLDLLEIPRLSNKALQAPLSALEALAVGSLGKTVTLRKPTRHSEKVGLMGARVDVAGGSKAISNEYQSRPAHASLFTSSIVAQVMSPGMFEENQRPPTSSAQAPPLSTLVLAHCEDLQVLPKLPAGLVHLDLRGASLQVPAAALATWKPLSKCFQLQVLNLAGNVLLTSRGLSACLASLPSPTQLKALDLSDSRPEAALLAALPVQVSALTHLRLCNCMALKKAELGELLRGLPNLEVLDAAGTCLEYPLSDLVPTTAAAGLADGRSQRQALAPNLRLLGLGRTELCMGEHLEYTRRALALIAPLAEALPGSLDVLDGYSELPPILI
eukprot:CAMPEP_0197662378 /NCGR_PEP_ID=MMETSP1338-20131121/53121_1 /TAXON_ID=43686 ORGANISM="Pelagodinium beii, Strain RCC1491" /NCGR_SAMPLE_ID=MMETSP1338 /ASSEMBLY_ACC=CAM_ASM_000754 /LENGTH=617 /DNA_ID=CAMNT_0043240205 /DNA_START=13 /DNA_END=1866 /DNA_ORIENTATION=-